MAPGLTDLFPTSPLLVQSKAIFADGIKTSGQHPPQYNQLQPYSSFPTQITGPTVWKAEDYANNPERWTHHFTEEEIAEMSDAADKFLAAGTPLTGITKVFGEYCPLEASYSPGGRSASRFPTLQPISTLFVQNC